MNLYLSNKKMSSTIELPYNEPLPFKQKNVFNHRITIEWTFTFQTKKCLQPPNYHTMNFYFSKKNVFHHRITIQWTFKFQMKKRLQPSTYHPMKLLHFNKKTSSTIELSYNGPLHFKQKNVFNERITIQWTFTFQTKKRLQPSNYHTMNLYLSNENMSSTIELPYNGPLPFKQKNVFNHQITIKWTFTFQTKKCFQPSNYHTMNLYLSKKNMSSTIELPYNETFTFQLKKRLQLSNYHPMNFYISNKNTSSTIELPSNEPLPFKQKNVFNHRITIEWTFTFQTKKCLQPSNYHTMYLYL